MNITHCVLMVCYNQEKYIRVALESIFNNELLPNKVVICDDCSSDKTWNIILEFKSKYYEIIDCYQNKKNIGLFQNFNQVIKLGLETKCDIISVCSGDDYLKKGLFNELNKVIEKNKIDVKNEKFIIISNTEELYPNGKVVIIDNYQLRNEKDLTYYRLTGKLSYREIGLSCNVLKNINLYRYDLGVWADLLVCLNYEQNCDKFYFTPFISAGYRRDVGTVSKQDKEVISKSRYDVEKIILKEYKLSKKSKSYLSKNILEYNFYLELNKFRESKRKTFPIFLYIKLNGIFEFTKKVILYFIKLLKK